MKLFFLFIGLCITSFCFGTLPPDWYNSRAQKFLNNIQKHNFCMHQLWSFVTQRIIRADLSLNNCNPLLINEEIQKLDFNACSFLHAYNHDFAYARMCIIYARMVEKLYIQALNKKLECYATGLKLKPFEKNYTIPLQEVTSEEFSKQLNTLKTHTIQTLLLKESKAFASAITRDIISPYHFSYRLIDSEEFTHKKPLIFEPVVGNGRFDRWHL